MLYLEVSLCYMYTIILLSIMQGDTGLRGPVGEIGLPGVKGSKGEQGDAKTNIQCSYVHVIHI